MVTGSSVPIKAAKTHDRNQLNWYQDPFSRYKKSLKNLFQSNFILIDFMPDQVSSFFLQLVRGSYKYLIMCSCQADENASKFSHLTWFTFTWLQM